MSGAEPPEGQISAPTLDEIEDEQPDAEADEQADAHADEQLVEPVALYPPVVAMVVTRNPGPWLDDALNGLAAQDYPDLTVLVVDCGSDVDPTPQVAAVLPRAFVRRLDASAGFAEAANEALHTVEGATFLLVCHDDVVPDPYTVRTLVEEAYRSNAGIVGPKLVSADDPRVLLEVGRAIDRFGVPYTGIEPGELDQEQHDGVRDVFYVTSATMLVRVDLFTQLGGFDPATFPGAEDLDLCWRARLEGARVLVAPDARVAHREAAEERTRADRPDAVALARSRVRVLFTSYSFLTLVWLIPVGIVVACFEAVGDLLIGRPRRARAAITAWFSNVFHFPRLRASRRRAQKSRTVRDRDLRELQTSTSRRLGAWFSHHSHRDGTIRSIGDAGRSAVGSVGDSMRTPATLAFCAFILLVLFGSRALIAHGVPATGTLAQWPSIGDLFNSFASAWRYTGLGSASPAPTGVAFIGLLGTLFLGATSLARTVVVVAAIPMGAFGTFRLSRRVIGLRGPALAAGLAYGINPTPQNALAQGRFGPLVLFALLPYLLSMTLRLAGFGAEPSASDDGAVADAIARNGQDADMAPRRRGRLLRIMLLAALLAAWYPAGLPLFVIAAAALVLAAPFAGDGRVALRALGIAVAASFLSLVLLFPWPIAYAQGTGYDGGALGLAFRTSTSLADALRFHTGPQGAGWAMWGLIFAAAVPLFIATGSRLGWAARGWILALVGWAIMWIPGRFFPHTSVLAPEAGLTLAALGLAIALGVGVAVLVDGIRTFRFGWRQPIAVVGGIAILLPALGFLADTFDGRWGAPSTDWTSALAFTESLSDRGQFRMLWVGNPAVLPLDPVVLDNGTGYTLTRNGPGDARELWRAPQHSADHIVDRAIGAAMAGLTNRLGRLLAPMGVRYVIMPITQGSGGGARAPASPALRAALDGQLDLARLQSHAGFVLYENLSWIPLASVVTGSAADSVPVGVVNPTRAALGVDLSTARPVGSGPVPAGTVLWGEAYDSDWSATARGSDLRHVVTFGWANGYRLEHTSTVGFSFDAQWERWAALAVALVIWLFVVWRWWTTRVRRERVRSSGGARERRERHDPLADVLDEDAFWWERV
jgi:GT2 family glycosyltransferase